MIYPVPKPIKKVKSRKTVITRSLPELKKRLQRIVNKYIRLRDEQELCISCQRYCPHGEAGHFWAQGSNGALRYNLDNIHKQCTNCNVWLSANLLEYRINLIKKIGKEKVEWLDLHHKDIKKWTREELEEVVNMTKILAQGYGWKL